MRMLFTPHCSRGTGGSSSSKSDPTAILRSKLLCGAVSAAVNWTARR